jgi:hypothetical protein
MINQENERDFTFLKDKVRRIALKVTTNIDSLIKDFFHNPPSYKTSITASWKSSEVQVWMLFFCFFAY